jgi:PhzF family phenazine biosynthesis protein
MSLQVILVKAFTQNKAEGNPAGVVLDANGLTAADMISISAKLGFSESAFVQASNVADFKVRFFTPQQEVPLCGHATIATFHALKEAGMIQLGSQPSVTKTQEAQAGLLPVTVHRDGLIVMTQPQPIYGEPVQDLAEVTDLLGLTPADLLINYPIQSVANGGSKLLIPLKSREVLFAIQPNFAGIMSYCKANNVRGFYPFTLDTIDPNSDFHARQFNPLLGINEDPITGVAAGALGSYAVKHKLLPKQTFVIEQGYIMDKPGKMYVEIGPEVTVGGYAVTLGATSITAQL